MGHKQRARNKEYIHPRLRGLDGDINLPEGTTPPPLLKIWELGLCPCHFYNSINNTCSSPLWNNNNPTDYFYVGNFINTTLMSIPASTPMNNTSSCGNLGGSYNPDTSLLRHLTTYATTPLTPGGTVMTMTQNRNMLNPMLIQPQVGDRLSPVAHSPYCTSSYPGSTGSTYFANPYNNPTYMSSVSDMVVMSVGNQWQDPTTNHSAGPVGHFDVVLSPNNLCPPQAPCANTYIPLNTGTSNNIWPGCCGKCLAGSPGWQSCTTDPSFCDCCCSEGHIPAGTYMGNGNTCP